MILVPVGKKYILLERKNIHAKPESILTIQNYMKSMSTDYQGSGVPVGIFDTIREKLGISEMNLFLDEKGRVYIQETNQDKSNLVQFSNLDSVGEYIDYITKLGIYCKLYNKSFSLERKSGQEEKVYIAANNNGDFVNRGESFEEFMMQHREKMQESQMRVYSDNEISLLDGENEIQAPELSDLTREILEKFSKMNLEDIYNSGISQYEYRKIIGMQYQGINLTQEDIEALSLYKHGMFDTINGFLRGDLSFITERKSSTETFVKNMPQIIDCIKKIADLQNRFISTKEMTLVRRDARINRSMETKLEYDNFVSTSANQRLFQSALDGIKSGGYVYIKIPKGTPMIPMDIVTEKRMSIKSRVNPLGGGDVGYEESEILLPMCEIIINSHFQNDYGRTIANATMVGQKNPIEIIEKRLEEYSSMIILYGGQKKLEELRAKVKNMKYQSIGKTEFTEQEIGKYTILMSTKLKDEAQNRQQRDKQQLVQDGQKNFNGPEE